MIYRKVGGVDVFSVNGEVGGGESIKGYIAE